jgi:hypothetical protein
MPCILPVPRLSDAGRAGSYARSTSQSAGYPAVITEESDSGHTDGPQRGRRGTMVG